MYRFMIHDPLGFGLHISNKAQPSFGESKNVINVGVCECNAGLDIVTRFHSMAYAAADSNKIHTDVLTKARETCYKVSFFFFFSFSCKWVVSAIFFFSLARLLNPLCFWTRLVVLSMRAWKRNLTRTSQRLHMLGCYIP